MTTVTGREVRLKATSRMLSLSQTAARSTGRSKPRRKAAARNAHLPHLKEIQLQHEDHSDKREAGEKEEKQEVDEENGEEEEEEEDITLGKAMTASWMWIKAILMGGYVRKMVQMRLAYTSALGPEMRQAGR